MGAVAPLAGSLLLAGGSCTRAAANRWLGQVAQPERTQGGDKMSDEIREEDGTDEGGEGGEGEGGEDEE